MSWNQVRKIGVETCARMTSRAASQIWGAESTVTGRETCVGCPQARPRIGPGHRRTGIPEGMETCAATWGDRSYPQGRPQMWKSGKASYAFGPSPGELP